MELLNSKVDHKDYQGDRTPFGVEIVKAVNSPRVKLLYDAYHMQIMEGDLIRTIRDQQGLHRARPHRRRARPPRARRRRRRSTGAPSPPRWRTLSFQGYMAHEFVPTRDPLTSLREAVALCDV